MTELVIRLHKIVNNQLKQKNKLLRKINKINKKKLRMCIVHNQDIKNSFIKCMDSRDKL